MSSDDTTDDNTADDTADTAGGAGSTPEERRAAFRVVRGEPTDAELVALTVTLAAAGGDPAPAAAGPRSVWNDRASHLRTALHPGPGAWRTSTWPR